MVLFHFVLVSDSLGQKPAVINAVQMMYKNHFDTFDTLKCYWRRSFFQNHFPTQIKDMDMRMIHSLSTVYDGGERAEYRVDVWASFQDASVSLMSEPV